MDARIRATVPSGSDWVGVFADRDRSRHRTVRRYSLSDPRFLLRVVTEQWRAFTDQLSRAEQGFATELRDTGNRWAHGEEFSDEDTYRALDTMERLLHAVGAAEHAADVRSIRLGPQPAAPQPQTRVADGGAAARGPSLGPMAEDTPNWRLILEAARALTATGQSPFTRISVYQWIWQRYPREVHDRPTLDPTFQGRSGMRRAARRVRAEPRCSGSNAGVMCWPTPRWRGNNSFRCRRIIRVHVHWASCYLPAEQAGGGPFRMGGRHAARA